MSKIESIKSEIDTSSYGPIQVTLTVSILLEESEADYFLRVTPNGCTIDRCYNKEAEE